MDSLIDFRHLWLRAWLRRAVVLRFVVVGTLLGLLAALFLPAWYRAQATLLPPSEEESGFGLAGLFRGIGVPGIRIPTQSTPAEVFLAILESRGVNGAIVREFDLQGRYRRRLMEDAIRELRRHARFKLTQSGTLEITVEDRDPIRAAAMANAYVAQLDHFNREVRMTKGRRTREFVEGRLAQTRKELKVSEQQLADYQVRHKTIALSAEASSAVETGARLFAQRAALQVRLGVIQGYSRGPSDEAEQVRQQLVQLDRQLAALPGTGLELARLIRDVRAQEGLYILLQAQYEEARINEVKDVATVELLDRAVPPERRARPRRSILVVGAFLLSLGVGLLWAGFRSPLDAAPATS